MKTIASLVRGLICKYGELQIKEDNSITFACDAKTINKIAKEAQEVILTEFTKQMVDLVKTVNTK